MIGKTNQELRTRLESEAADLEKRLGEVRVTIATLERLEVIPGIEAGPEEDPPTPASTPPEKPIAKTPKRSNGKRARNTAAGENDLRKCPACDYRGSAPALGGHMNKHPLPDGASFNNALFAELVATRAGGVTRLARDLKHRVGFGSAATISNYCDGKTSPPEPVARVLSEILGCRYAALVETGATA